MLAFPGENAFYVYCVIDGFILNVKMSLKKCFPYWTKTNTCRINAKSVWKILQLFRMMIAHANDMKQQQMEINIKIDNVVSDIRKELAVNLQEIKDEVNNCKNLVHANDINTKKKFCEVELLNHLVQHRLNRADIIITGLSKDIKELTEIIISICEH